MLEEKKREEKMRAENPACGHHGKKASSPEVTPSAEMRRAKGEPGEGAEGAGGPNEAEPHRTQL